MQNQPQVPRLSANFKDLGAVVSQTQRSTLSRARLAKIQNDARWKAARVKSRLHPLRHRVGPSSRLYGAGRKPHVSAPILGIQAPSDRKRRYPSSVRRHILKLETNKGGNAKDAGHEPGSSRCGRWPGHNQAAPTVTLSFTLRSKRLTPGWWVDIKVNVYIRGRYGN